MREKADVAGSTVTRFERGENINMSSFNAMKSSYESAGVTFLPDDGNGPGVRFRARDDDD